MDELGYATRRQLQHICNLGGDRNASRILLRLERDKAIQSDRREFKVYSVTHRGKEEIGSTRELRAGQLEHTIMRNDLYIRLGMPGDWQTEYPIKFKDETMRCDAFFTSAGEFHFVEIDNRQTMSNNFIKLDKYAQFTRAIFRKHHHHPSVIFYTTTQHRKEKLEGYMRKVGVKGIVYA